MASVSGVERSYPDKKGIETPPNDYSSKHEGSAPTPTRRGLKLRRGTVHAGELRERSYPDKKGIETRHCELERRNRKERSYPDKKGIETLYRAIGIWAELEGALLPRQEGD